MRGPKRTDKMGFEVRQTNTSTSVQRLRPTDLDREARRQAESDEVAKLGKVCV